MSYMKPWEAERKAELFKKQTDSEIKIARRTVHRLTTDDEQGRLGYESALELDVLLRAANEVGGVEKLQNQFGDQGEVFRQFGTAKERHPVKSEKHRELMVRHFIEIMGDLDVMQILRRDGLYFPTALMRLVLARNQVAVRLEPQRLRNSDLSSALCQRSLNSFFAIFPPGNFFDTKSLEDRSRDGDFAQFSKK